ncbi:MAG: anaerobic ribonucleoside-triphosphate reductase activating protein [Clostridia bacterium]|nr:anaerobic ribonucleoside-triphosphate reductase activating protein [Clostridia bacterium]
MIAGLQKMTLLDFPGKVACTLFLQGCNWRCPFCHNSGLLSGPAEDGMETDAFLRFLKSRKGLLDGVCVSGGEPTLQKDLPSLLESIREMGYAIKLDTNGSRPEVLRQLAEQHLVDYVAMDIKNGPSTYAQTCGIPYMDMGPIEESIQYLVSSSLPHEFRTTLVHPLHSDNSVLEMGKWLASLVPGKKPEKLFLQRFQDRDTVLFAGFAAPTEDDILRWKTMLAPYVQDVVIRGK